MEGQWMAGAWKQNAKHPDSNARAKFQWIELQRSSRALRTAVRKKPKRGRGAPWNVWSCHHYSLALCSFVAVESKGLRSQILWGEAKDEETQGAQEALWQRPWKFRSLEVELSGTIRHTLLKHLNINSDLRRCTIWFCDIHVVQIDSTCAMVQGYVLWCVRSRSQPSTKIELIKGH